MKRIIMAVLATVAALFQVGVCAYAAPEHTAYAEVKVEALPVPDVNWVNSLQVDQVYAPEGATPKVSARQDADGIGEIGFTVDLPGDYRFRVEQDKNVTLWDDYDKPVYIVDLSVFDTEVDGLYAVPLVYREGSDSKLEKMDFISLTYGHYFEEEYETEYESETEIEEMEDAEGTKHGNTAGGPSTGNSVAASGAQASNAQQGTDAAAGGKASIAANAKTGDNTNIALYVALAVLSIVCIAAAWKRRHADEG